MTESELRVLIAKIPDEHHLRRGGPSYLDGFVRAFLAVYPASMRAHILQRKFFVPDQRGYTDDAFYASASELSVANHIRQQPKIQNFAIDRRVNVGSRKDVDVFFQLRAIAVATEVKCPLEFQPGHIEQERLNLRLMTAGRVPDHQRQLDELKQLLESTGEHSVSLGKNRDLTLKDYLIDANAKFSPDSSVDNLNILFIAAGYVDRMSDFYMNLYGTGELFTAESFHAATQFDLVDVVILSNLRYWHQHAAGRHDWTLRDVFLLPRLNPMGRMSRMLESVSVGLSVFDHHLVAFNRFNAAAGDGVPEYVLQPMKLMHYVNQHMTEADRDRYFPIKLYPLGKAPPPRRA